MTSTNSKINFSYVALDQDSAPGELGEVDPADRIGVGVMHHADDRDGGSAPVIPVHRGSGDNPMTVSEERPAALDLHADDAARDLRVAGDVDVEVAAIVAPPIYLVDDEAMTLKQRPYRVDAASLRTVADAESLPWRVIVHTATLRPMTD